jgi:hypothetical protein
LAEEYVGASDLEGIIWGIDAFGFDVASAMKLMIAEGAANKGLPEQPRRGELQGLKPSDERIAYGRAEARPSESVSVSLKACLILKRNAYVILKRVGIVKGILFLKSSVHSRGFDSRLTSIESRLFVASSCRMIRGWLSRGFGGRGFSPDVIAKWGRGFSP